LKIYLLIYDPYMNDLKKQARFLKYILGLRPDEFGLVPDREGYVKIKELLKAIHEEEGWRSFRQANINEVMVSLPDPLFEISENRIRAKDTQQIPKRVSPENLPKLLFTCIRPKALHAILEKGILPMGRKQVILSSDINMAKRIGNRIHASPALLTVRVQNATQQGTLFLQTGENLFLARSIPVGCFTAPPLPKEPRVTKPKEPVKPRERDRTPGSFFSDLTGQVETTEPQKMTRKQRREKDIDWKKSRKKMRRR
jgi:putative RNA 2'-phosphotransferase